MLNGTLGAIFYFTLAKLLSTSEYGVFITATTLMTMLSSLADFGSNQTMIKFFPKDNFKFPKLALKLKVLSGGVISLIFLFYSSLIAKYFFLKPELAVSFKFVGIGTLCLMLFSFSYSLAQAQEKYTRWGLLFVGTNAVRLLGVVALYFMGILTAFSTIILFILLPALGFIFGLWGNEKILQTKDENSKIKEFLGFNKWVTGFVVLSTLASKVDTLMMGRFLDLSSVAVYGLATQMVLVFQQLSLAIGAVTSPKLAGLKTVKQNNSYVSRVLKVNTVIFVGVTLFLVPLATIFTSYLGKHYSQSMLPFFILIISSGMFFILSPIRDSILYFLSKPNFFVYMGAIILIINILFSWWLIPAFGILGAALVSLLGQLILSMSSILYYAKKNNSPLLN
jgi:O-antigen/teichoic acid export membrane protein